MNACQIKINMMNY